MSEYKRQTAEARILTRVLELAKEFGLEISVRSRSSGRHTHADFIIWADRDEDRDEIGLVLGSESLRCYETDPAVQTEVDDKIREYLKQ